MTCAAGRSLPSRDHPRQRIDRGLAQIDEGIAVVGGIAADDDPAALDHGIDRPLLANILQRIPIEDDQVRELARLDRAEQISLPIISAGHFVVP